MMVTDTRLSESEKALLTGMIGKTLEAYRCDDRTFGGVTSSFGIVGIWVGGEVYAVANEVEGRMHFGELDDVAALSIAKASADDLASPLVGQKQVDVHVGKTIEDVCLYEDTQTQLDGGVAVCDYRFTSAIVFRFAHSQLVLGSSGWMSEDIEITRGPHAEGGIVAADEFVPEDDRNRRKASRVTVSLKEWPVGRYE